MGTDKIFKSKHKLCKKTRHDKGAFSEHLCDDSWASKQTKPSREDFLKAQESTSRWRYMCLGEDRYDRNAWEFLTGAESEQADKVLMRVHMSSDSSSMDVQEDVQKQGRLVRPREIRREDPPTPPLETVRRIIRDKFGLRPRRWNA